MTFQDIWLGNSIELCERFKEGRVQCIITDPPFGIDNLSNMAVTQSGKEHARKIEGDESPEKAIATFKAVMRVLLTKTAPECDMYVFTSYQVLADWIVMTREFLPHYGFEPKATLVWEKDGPGMGDTNCPWGQGCEFILFFQKGPREKTGTRRNNVIHVPQLRPEQLIHPHEKPVQLLELFIKQSTIAGDFIVDPFGGSGSLVRAAQRTDRSAIAIELNEINYKKAKHKFETGEGEGMEF
ncbi:MAG TPA: site-specific DNA-methyltransferase [Candidatus Paceibacterota bacterium]|jgi:DNA modification methylase